MKNRLSILLIIFLLSPILFAGEGYNTVKGRVVNDQTGEPIQNVNVFLAHTLVGTTTNSNGEYLIKTKENGQFEIVVSHIQYNNQKEDIVLRKGITLLLDYKLVPKIYELPEVCVEDDSKEWWSYYNKFKENLLGYTANADSCEILNPFEVDFESIGIDNFKAYSNSPLFIVNKSLGYRVTYFMEYFHTNKELTKFSGTPFFQLLSTDNDSVKNQWEVNRIKTYNGSLRDFLTDLCYSYNCQKDNIEYISEFEIKLLHHPDAKYLKEAYYPIGDLSEYISSTAEVSIYQVSFPDKVKVYYTNSKNKPTNCTDCSIFSTPEGSMNIDFLGRNHDKFGILTYGYWNQQRLADMLPLEYFHPGK